MSLSTEAKSRISQTLWGRRQAIAKEWYEAIAPTCFVPFSAAEGRRCCVELVEEIITLLLAEPFELGRVQAIGASLVGLQYMDPVVLGRTQEVLVRQLVKGLPADQVVALQPRLAALLGGLATGFSHKVREAILTQQECTWGILTAELRAANEWLRGEITARRRGEESL